MSIDFSRCGSPVEQPVDNPAALALRSHARVPNPGFSPQRRPPIRACVLRPKITRSRLRAAPIVQQPLLQQPPAIDRARCECTHADERNHSVHRRAWIVLRSLTNHSAALALAAAAFALAAIRALARCRGLAGCGRRTGRGRRRGCRGTYLRLSLSRRLRSLRLNHRSTGLLTRASRTRTPGLHLATAAASVTNLHAAISPATFTHPA